jgi:hypothetical protein
VLSVLLAVTLATVLAPIQDEGRVHGRVLDGEGRPAAGVAVRLGRRGKLDGRAGSTDGEGRFSFWVPEGRYLLRAEAGDFLYTEPTRVRVGVGQTVEVDLALPPATSLSGRVLAPVSASFEGLTICAVPDDELGPFPVTYFRHVVPGPHLPRSTLDAEGRFALDRLPVDPVTLFLVLPTRRWVSEKYAGSSWLTPGPAIVVGSARLRKEPNRTDVDLRPAFPGRLEVEVRIAGEPAAGAIVRARPCWPDGRVRRDFVWLRLDPKGQGELAPLFAGEWQIELLPREEAPVLGDPVRVTIPSAGAASLVLER